MKSPRLLFAALLLATIGALLYYRYYTATAMLARVGVHFNDHAAAFESNGLNRVRFWFDSPAGELAGPEIDGDLLYVEPPYHTADGHLEFAVQSRVYESGRVRIQLVSPPRGEVAFHVAEDDARKLNVHFPAQGIQGTP